MYVLHHDDMGLELSMATFAHIASSVGVQQGLPPCAVCIAPVVLTTMGDELPEACVLSNVSNRQAKGSARIRGIIAGQGRTRCRRGGGARPSPEDEDEELVGGLWGGRLCFPSSADEGARRT